MDVRTKETLKFIFNIIFALYNSVLGIASQSWWFVSAGVYYAVLSVVRIAIVTFSKSNKEHVGFITKFTGIFILLLSFILSGIVYMTVNNAVAVKYPEIAMITIALYAFVKVTVAIMGYVKSGKGKSGVLRALRSIALADAVASIYSLQRSMLVSFGEMATKDIMLFNILSGIGMCIITAVTGISLLKRKDVKNG